MQKPILLFPMARNPIGGDRIHLIRVFQPAFAGVIGFMEPVNDLVGRMALGEGTDAHSMITCVPERGAECLERVSRTETASVAFGVQVGAFTAMIYNACEGTGSAAEKGGSAGQTRRVGGKQPREANTLRCQLIDARRGVPVIAVAAQMIGAQRIDIDVKNTHKGSNSRRGALSLLSRR